jgi:F-type H+-transporting ATPase subunit alpha
MKQVAGSMKLDLAQFRELEAFAQFASDLDAKTKAQIDRGQRLTQLLKQGWDRPMDVTEQIAVIYAGTRGLLDTVQKDLVVTWEVKFLEFMSVEGQEVYALIKKEQKLNEQIEADLKRLITKFNSIHTELMIEE